METLKLRKGHLQIPLKYEDVRPITITMPWQKHIIKHAKGAMQESIQVYFRHKPQKPYIEEGFVEINGERFKVERE